MIKDDPIKIASKDLSEKTSSIKKIEAALAGSDAKQTSDSESEGESDSESDDDS